jgi:hypothetical protein
LILVDKHVVETVGDRRRDCRLGHHLGPVEQQIVVVEDVLPLLRLDINGEQVFQLELPVPAPGKLLPKN